MKKLLLIAGVIIFITLFGCEYVINPDVTLDIPDGALSVDLPDLSTFLNNDDCNCPICDAGVADSGTDGGEDV